MRFKIWVQEEQKKHNELYGALALIFPQIPDLKEGVEQPSFEPVRFGLRAADEPRPGV